ncbi:MAG: thiamine pyrophosphate-dependent enzyme, partial [Luteolibacter sp.]
ITEAVRRARSGMGPQMVVARLLRLSGHGEHDDAFYVSQNVRENHYGLDCIEVAKRQLMDHGFASEAEITEWQRQVADEVQRAVAQAQQEPAPNPYRESWTALATRFPLNTSMPSQSNIP